MTDTLPPKLYCANHPDRETSLRCNRCEKPICPQCAVLTPTGYRCKECVRGQQKIFETAVWKDYPLAFLTAGFLSFLGSYLSQWFSFFTLILAPIVGMLVAEAVRFVIHKRRSKGLFLTASAAAALGSLPQLIMPVIFLLFSLSGGSSLVNLGGSGLSLIWQILYSVLVTSTVYYRLSGIRVSL